MNTKTKRCSKCGKTKPLSEFHKKFDSKDGHAHSCKKCSIEYQKQYRVDHKDKIIESSKRYYFEHKEDRIKYNKKYQQTHKEEILVNKQEYYKNNRSKKLKNQKKYQQTHKEEILMYQRKYRQSSHGKVIHKNSKHRRRMRKKATPKEHHITEIQWNKIIKSQKNCCASCGVEFTEEIQPTMDHILPLSKGGSHSSDNIQALCQSCNSSKRDKIDFGMIQSWI